MDTELKYRGKIATTDDIEFIKKLIAENPNDTRRALSIKLCVEWNWVQPNGQLRDMVCRGFMLQLHRAGYIKLPAKKCHPNNPFVNRQKPPKLEVDQSLTVEPLSKIRPVEIQIVRGTPNEKLFNSLIDQYHYLGYCHPVGEQLKYLIFANDRPVAAFSWSSAPRHIGCRDRFIGWSPETRKKNIHLIAYNNRFLIPDWVRVHHLASHLLGLFSRRISSDWERIYNHPVYFLETFVDTSLYKGTCYQASNWLFLGKTTGRGKNDQTNKVNRTIKDVYGYPLIRDFREKIRAL